MSTFPTCHGTGPCSRILCSDLLQFLRSFALDSRHYRVRSGSAVHGQILKSLMNSLQVRLRMSSAYHSQSDGQMEKVNHVIGTYLRVFARHQPDKWDSLLPLGEFAYNLSTYAVTRKMPFELDLSYVPRVPIDLALHAVIQPVMAHAKDSLCFPETMENHIGLARDSLARAQDDQKARADLTRQEAPFQVGQKVCLSMENLPLTYSNLSDQRSRKLQDLEDGPLLFFRVLTVGM
jgi:hypothetical protein